MTEFLRNTDAFTWSMEADPRLRSTVVTLMILDRSPDWELVRDRFELVSRELPMFRQRVVNSPPPAPPRWQRAPDFDLGYHLRRVSAPRPGDLAGVLEMARLAAMADFDRARPMWEVTLIEGLDDGGAAVLCKFHHALTDGVGGVQIAMTLFDLTEEPQVAGPIRDESPAPAPRLFASYRDCLRYDLAWAGRAVTESVKIAPKLLLNTIQQPLQTAGAAGALAASVYRTIRPVSRTSSPLMKERTLVRRLGVLDVPMPRLREAAHRSGAALNDAFVAGVAGGLRRYHDKHGVGVFDLHLTMPISLRTDDDGMGGNRITLMRFDVPAGISDPARRISSIHECTDRVRKEESLPYTQVIAGVLNVMPRWYIGSILRHVDFLCSDVPGVPMQVYLGGAQVRRQYAFGPTVGAAVNVTLLTYMDTCALGIDVDTGAIPDCEEFYDCLAESFDEVLALAD